MKSWWLAFGCLELVVELVDEGMEFGRSAWRGVVAIGMVRKDWCLVFRMPGVSIKVRWWKKNEVEAVGNAEEELVASILGAWCWGKEIKKKKKERERRAGVAKRMKNLQLEFRVLEVGTDVRW